MARRVQEQQVSKHEFLQYAETFAKIGEPRCWLLETPLVVMSDHAISVVVDSLRNSSQ